MVFTGCGTWEPNHPDATFWKNGDRYIVEVTGKRLYMNHEWIDLIKVIFSMTRKTFEDKEQFDLPKIEGEIDGREIRQEPGDYPYIGKITIRSNVMTIKISYDNYDDKKTEPISWNGKYKLIENESRKGEQPKWAWKWEKEPWKSQWMPYGAWKKTADGVE